MSSGGADIGARRRVAPFIDGCAALLATRAAWWSVLAGTCAVLLVPLFLVDVPPLLDYPNHLARMYVLAFGAHDPILSQMYEQHWAIIPNLAIDLVMPEMLKVLPIYLAGRVVLGVTLLLPLVGAIVYHRVAFGVRSYWPLTAALGAYNALFIFGFMNFLLALGMALLAAAGWLRWRETHPVWVTGLGALTTIAIFFMHLFGLVFLGVLVGCEEFSTFQRVRRTGGVAKSHLLRRAAMGAIVFTPPLVLCLLAPHDHLGGVVMYRPLWHKVYGLTEPFQAYDGLVDSVTGCIILCGIHLAWRQRGMRVAAGTGLALAVLFAAYLACPFFMQGTAFVDARFPIMIGLLLFAGLRPRTLSSRARLGIAAVLALVFIGRTASVAEVWLERNRDLADFRRVIAAVQPGSRVLVVSVEPEDAPAYWAGVPRSRGIPGFFRLDSHLPALLLIERRAFFPYLFTVAAKQPLAVRPPFNRLSVPEGQPPDWRSLVLGYSVNPLVPAPYLRDWWRNYDDVLLLNAGGAGDLTRYLPDRLTLLAATDVAALFRIRNPAQAVPAAGFPPAADRPTGAVRP
jgi:hypothetical protein